MRFHNSNALLYWCSSLNTRILPCRQRNRLLAINQGCWKDGCDREIEIGRSRLRDQVGQRDLEGYMEGERNIYRERRRLRDWGFKRLRDWRRDQDRKIYIEGERQREIFGDHDKSQGRGSRNKTDVFGNANIWSCKHTCRGFESLKVWWEINIEIERGDIYI